MNVKQAQAWIRDHRDDQEAIQQFLVSELNGKNRKTVIKAAHKALERFETTAEPVRAREDDGTFVEDDPSTPENEAYEIEPPPPGKTPVPAAPGHEPGSIRWVWYDRGHQRRLGITFLNADDQARFGPNIDLARYEAKNQGWDLAEPKGAAVVALPGQPAPAQAAVQPQIAQGDPAKLGPRANQEGHKAGPPAESLAAPKENSEASVPQAPVKKSDKAGNPAVVGPRGNQPSHILSDDHPEMVRRRALTGSNFGPRGSSTD